MSRDNDELRQLEEIVASDDYDVEAGKLVHRLREKWDMAVATENLGQHIVIKEMVAEFQTLVSNIKTVLENQEVLTPEDINKRFQLQADQKAFERIINLFTGERTKQVDAEISHFRAKTKALGD